MLECLPHENFIGITEQPREDFIAGSSKNTSGCSPLKGIPYDRGKSRFLEICRARFTGIRIDLSGSCSSFIDFLLSLRFLFFRLIFLRNSSRSCNTRNDVSSRSRRRFFTFLLFVFFFLFEFLKTFFRWNKFLGVTLTFDHGRLFDEVLTSKFSPFFLHVLRFQLITRISIGSYTNSLYVFSEDRRETCGIPRSEVVHTLFIASIVITTNTGSKKSSIDQTEFFSKVFQFFFSKPRLFLVKSFQCALFKIFDN